MTFPAKPRTPYGYVDYQTSSPSDPLPATEVAADFNSHKASIDAVIDFQQLIQRSDGRLNNGSVRPETLSSGTVALIGKWTPRGAWVTATAYAVNDLVTESNDLYVCIEAHTSGVFATDLAAGKWMLMDGDTARVGADNVFTGTNEFDGAVSFDSTVDFDAAVDFSAAETHSGAVTFSGTIGLGASATATTPSVGTDSTALATMAALQAATAKVYIQKFESVPTTVTVTIATPAVLSWTSHKLAVGQAFQVTTSGNLPTGMTVSTTYFVISAGFGADSFQFSATRGGAAINTSGSQSGTHTGTPFYAPSAGMVNAIGETWGGGGGGAGIGTSASSSAAAGGGGAGSYSRKLMTAADVGAGVLVNIGAAGAAGATGNNAGGNGGDTSIGSLCVGKGGTGAPANGSNVSGLGGAGGVAGTGDVTGTGEPGGNGVGQIGLVSVPPVSGKGGSTSVGGGGRSAVQETATSVLAGNAGSGFGSGGSGAVNRSAGGATTAPGGASTAGYVVITEFCNQ